MRAGAGWFNRGMRDHFPDSGLDTIDNQLEVFCRALKAANDLHFALHFPTLQPSTFGYTKAKKYARVFRDDGPNQRFVVCFVQLNNGDIWKADGWKAPALNFVRGNIASDEGRERFIMEKLGPNGYFYPGL